VTPPPREDRHNCPSLFNPPWAEVRGYHEVVGVDKIYKYIRRVFQPTPFSPKLKYKRDLKPYEYKSNLQFIIASPLHFLQL